MELKEIMSITGQPGLFKFISQGRSGLIVEALIDKKRATVSQTAKVSSLKDIAVFTTASEVSLGKVLLAIKEKCNGQPAIDAKAATEEALRAFFAEVLPDYDKERVYLSDIRKMVAWYNLLQKVDMLDFEVKDEEAESAEAAEGDKAPAVAPTPAKAAPKPTAAKPVKQASTKAAGSAGKINAPRKAQ